MDWYTTSIGIAETKTLSKVANHIAKKQKSGVVSLVNIKDLDPILEKVEVRDIWGVGKQLSKFYIENGIYNAKQLKNKSNTDVIKKFQKTIFVNPVRNPLSTSIYISLFIFSNSK